MTAMNEQAAMSRLVSSLETIWEAICKRHTEVPLAVLVVASGEGDRHGHFAKGTWNVDEARVPEVMVAGESLRKGARFVLQILLHEAGHGLGSTREVKNTSRQGRYHNKEYKALAEEMGLVFPNVDKKSPVYKAFGYAFPEMPDETYALYEAEVAELELVIQGFYRLSRLEDEGDQEEKENSTVAAVCQCRQTARGDKMVDGPRRIRISRNVLELGGIACELCGSLFEAEK